MMDARKKAHKLCKTLEEISNLTDDVASSKMFRRRSQ